MLLKSIPAAILLSAVALASPLALFQDKRACPAPTVTTSSSYLPNPTATFYSSTRTQPIIFYSVNITTSITTTYTTVIYKEKTIYHPPVSVQRVSTLYTSFELPTSTSVYGTVTSTTTLPAPTDPCFVTTCIKELPPTSTVSVTYGVTVFVNTIWSTIRTAWSNVEISKTSTLTYTSPRSTKVLSTYTSAWTYAPVDYVLATEWKTAYSTSGPAVCT